jgi:hypothetical protein
MAASSAHPAAARHGPARIAQGSKPVNSSVRQPVAGPSVRPSVRQSVRQAVTGAVRGPRPAEFFKDSAWLKDHTLVLRFSGRVRPILREDLIKTLSVVGVTRSDFVAMGPVEEGRAWHLVMISDHARDAILARDHYVFHQGQFRVESVTRAVAKVRVHWLPLHVPHEAVAAQLRQFGEVKNSSYEFSTSPGMEAVATIVRSFVVALHQGVSREDLPFMGSLSYEGEALTFLCTVQGRAPRCFRCKGSGHIRPDCPYVYCRHCRGWGDHSPEECERVETYASRSRGPQVAPTDLVVSAEDAPELFPQENDSSPPVPYPVQSLDLGSTFSGQASVAEPPQPAGRAAEGNGLTEEDFPPLPSRSSSMSSLSISTDPESIPESVEISAEQPVASPPGAGLGLQISLPELQSVSLEGDLLTPGQGAPKRALEGSGEGSGEAGSGGLVATSSDLLTSKVRKCPRKSRSRDRARVSGTLGSGGEGRRERLSRSRSAVQEGRSRSRTADVRRGHVLPGGLAAAASLSCSNRFAPLAAEERVPSSAP